MKPFNRDPEFDRDGYPTEATLDRIRQWECKRREDCARLLEFVALAWSDYGMIRRPTRSVPLWRGAEHRERRWVLATGGWSGNESIIAALDANVMFTMLCWYSSQRGGRHEYRVAA